MPQTFVRSCLIALLSVPLWSASDPALLHYLPSGAKVVVGVDVSRALNSEFGKRFWDRATSDEKFTRLLTESGVDPRRDLHSMLIASTGDQGQQVLVARGAYDIAQITAAAVKHGGVSQAFQGNPLISWPQNVIAFPAPDIAVIGDLQAVKRAIAEGATGATTLGPALRSEIEGVANRDVWFASTEPLSKFGGQAQMLGPAAQNGAVGQSIVAEWGGINVANSLQFNFHALTRSPKDAQSLSDVIQFAANMAETKAQQIAQGGPALAKAIEQNLNVAVNGSSVEVTGSVPEQALEGFLTAIKH